MIVVVIRGGSETSGAETAEEGSAPPVVGLAFLVPGHAGPGGVHGQLVFAVTAPADGDAVTVDRPVRVSGVLLANKVVEAVCMELNLQVYGCCVTRADNLDIDSS